MATGEKVASSDKAQAFIVMRLASSRTQKAQGLVADFLGDKGTHSKYLLIISTANTY